ncbi:MAG: hypothetical protein IJT87_02490 [Ruminiclostridium sp.]|nr:hypothetical protein [Ruminiclostridium sp.]
MIPDLTNEINGAVKRLGQIALENAKDICPVVTGNLMRSIRLEEAYDRAKQTTTAIICTTVHYAKQVELGGPYNTPRHYLGGGLEKARQRVGTVFTVFLGGYRK